MLEEITSRLVDITSARTGGDLTQAVLRIARDFGFGSVVLIDFASASHSRDRIVDTETWRGRWWLDFLTGPSGPEARAVLERDRPAVYLTPNDLGHRPQLLADLRGVEVLDALIVPVIADGRLMGMVGYCGAAGPVDADACRMLELIAYPAIAYFRGLPCPVPGESRLHLTEREKQVVRLAAAGLTSREIAQSLGISVRTTNQHIDNVGNKLATRNRAHTVAEAMRLELLA